MYFLRTYPKLIGLAMCMASAYIMFAAGGLHWLDTIPTSAEYLAVFIGGLLFSFGFTSPFGIGIFLELGHNVHPVYAGLLGGFGSLLSDLVIFEIMRFELFHDEMHHLRTSRFFRWAHGVLHHDRFPKRLKDILLWSFAGIIIASPLPDEFGVALVSSVTDIHARSFAFLCFSFNTAAIILLLLVSRGFA
ncbi:MAG: hypothetical protein KBC47_04300 [Candidatus Peribacteraceae bacterium]|nr:hypothetical protein [Candidatus Peribacteraceae bacterium]